MQRVLVAVLAAAGIISCEKETVEVDPFKNGTRYDVLDPISLPMRSGSIRLFKGEALALPDWVEASMIEDGYLSVSYGTNLCFGMRRDTMDAVMNDAAAIIRVPLAQAGFSTLTESDCLLVEQDVARIKVLTGKPWQIRTADGTKVMSKGNRPETACFPAQAGEEYYFESEGVSVPLVAVRREEIRHIVVPSEGGVYDFTGTKSGDSYLVIPASWISALPSTTGSRISVSPSAETSVREAVLTVTDRHGNVTDRVLVIQNTGVIEGLHQPGIYKEGKPLLQVTETVIERIIEKKTSTEIVFTDIDGVMDFCHFTIVDSNATTIRLGQELIIRTSGFLYDWSGESTPAIVTKYADKILHLSLEDGTIIVLHL